jgi:CheY-like chemotaxis protein
MTAPATFKIPSVLIVEDDRDVREALVEVLEEEGFGVAAASNGVEALGYLREAIVLPRLILLDLMMPVMDGRQFRCEQLKVPQWRSVPVFVMTATGNFKDEEKVMCVAGAIRKPLHLIELFALVDRYQS